MKYLKWLLWSSIYLFRPQPKTLVGLLYKLQRTRSPWWKFEPHVWHNEDYGAWEIYFEDEPYYVTRMTMLTDVRIGFDSGKIVGLNVFDDALYTFSGNHNGN